MKELIQALKQSPVVYVTRDIERALGLPLDTEGYFIISNATDFAMCVQKDHPDSVLLIDEKEQLDTWELLQHPKVIEFLRNVSSPSKGEGRDEVNVLVFKPTKQIEELCKKMSWHLLNPQSTLANKAEEKISQIEWLGDLKKYLPDYQVKLCKNIDWNGERFVLQFNRSHTGSGTTLVENETILNEIKQTFPNREARIAPYIEGPLFTNNNVVTAQGDVLIGNISYQITGLEPFTDRPFATIGNDWGVVKKMLTPEQITYYKQIAQDVGKKFFDEGWRGLFGIDVVLDEKTGRLYLLEINARQAASTTYESQLQNAGRGTRDEGREITTFEAHLASLLNLNLNKYSLILIDDGAQIIQRVTKDIPTLSVNKGMEMDFSYILYNNTKPNSDLLRIQTPYTIIRKHNELNRNGRTLIDFVIAIKDGKTWNMPRGGIIFIKNSKILLLERHKFGKNFFALPGGTQEEGENIKDTAIREGVEETGLEFSLQDIEPIHIDNNGRDEYYFFSKDISGTPQLGEEESGRNTPQNSYKLVWVNLDELDEINLIPEEIKRKILQGNNGTI